MRKSFDSLHALVTGQPGEDPRSGAVFVFSNKCRNRIKLLHWDGTICEERVLGASLTISPEREWAFQAEDFPARMGPP